jgi:cell wall-associated NlpC family hydrolase
MRFTKKRIIIISKVAVLILLLFLCTTFNAPRKQSSVIVTPDTALKELPLNDEAAPRQAIYYVQDDINTGNTTPAALISFARTLIGTPYLYASTDPAKGFDCSGFITYVFNHFGIAVPRSSVDFTSVGKEVNEYEARPGDLILFTGTDSTIRVVGHMGIITSNQNDLLEFIHSTSGKQKGVVITPMKDYYRSRFVKIVRVFNQSS